MSISAGLGQFSINASKASLKAMVDNYRDCSQQLTLVLLMYFTYTCLCGVKYRRGYLEFQDTYGRNFNGCTHVFEVQLFNGVVKDVTGSRVIAFGK